MPSTATLPPSAPSNLTPVDVQATDPAPLRLTAPELIAQALLPLLRQPATLAIHAAPADGLSAPVGMGRVEMVDATTARMGIEAEDAVLLPNDPGGTAWLCVTQLQGVKAQFTVHGIWQVDAAGQMRLETSLPTELIKLQRRRHARIEAPVGQSYRAEFVLDRRHYALVVDDMSLGGVGLRAAPKEVTLLQVGRRIKQVVIELGHGGTLRVDLEVRSRRKFTSYLVGEQMHIGCSFASLPADAGEQLKWAIDMLARETRR